MRRTLRAQSRWLELSARAANPTLPHRYLTPGLDRTYSRNMNTTTLTEDQVDTLWRGAAAIADRFLEQMCEKWLDADGDTRASYDATIRSHIKGSRLEIAIAA